MNLLFQKPIGILCTVFYALFFLSGCGQEQQVSAVFSSEELIVNKIGDHSYQHISYLHTKEWGKVGCNGLVVVDEGKALIIDTPSSQQGAEELMTWLSDSLKLDVVGVIATHFHTDCLGTLDYFHSRGIQSFAYQLTIDLAEQTGKTVPQNKIDFDTAFKIGEIGVQSKFCGEGHTKDNIVCYVTSDDVLFGGCLVKCLKAGKGNLEDANINAWSHTVEKVQHSFPKVKVVVPGHGPVGGVDLLEYTINKFQP